MSISSDLVPPCPGSIKRCCARSVRAAPVNSARCSTPANPVGPSTWSLDRAATGTVPPASTRRPRPGSRSRPTAYLPCPYFLVTFTLPAELHEFARSHQRVIYSALFEASSAARAPWRPTPSSSAPIALASSASSQTWGSNVGVPPGRALRGARWWGERGRQSLATVVHRLLRAREGPVDPLPGQVPRPPEAARLTGPG